MSELCMSDLSFTHLDPLGRARMVDVTPKEATHRRAVARCKVMMKPETTLAIANREVKKGDVLSVARVAGIQAAKRTSDMIPLCHPLLVGSVSVNFDIGDDYVAVEAQVDTVDRTGVEMEALHACADGGADDLRHVQVGRPRHGHRRADAVGEDRRPIGHLPPPDVGGGRRTARPERRPPRAHVRRSGDGGERSGPPIDVPEGTTVVASSSANVVES